MSKVGSHLLVYLLFSFVVISNCHNFKEKEKSYGKERKGEVALVTSVKVYQKDVPVKIKAIGHVEASSSVTIKSRVGGELIKIHFTEGDRINKNSLLFEIDPRQYEISLEEAKAKFEKEKVLLKKAEEDLKRYEELKKKDYVTDEKYKEMVTNLQVLKANLKASEASIKNINLQLEYTKIKSPIEGRAGNLLVHEGELIQPGDNKGLVVINKISPVYVKFSIPEKYLNDIRKEMEKGELIVEALLSESTFPIKGKLNFFNNEVDSSTGTIQLKGFFPNEDEILWPGQFVNVSLTIFTIKNAIVIPSKAVLGGEQGEFTFVIKEDKSVEVRTIKTGITFDNEVVILEGLNVGEEIVTEGQLRLFAGAKVEVLKKSD